MEPLTLEHLIRLTVAIVLYDTAALRALAKEIGRIGHAKELHEAALQCHLFCGFPRTLSALDVLRDAGMKLQDPGYGSPTPGAGDELFQRIYGEGTERVRGHLELLSPTFAGWIRDHAYGAALSRPGLHPAKRELLAVAALSATGHDRQLASHARGAVRCGATAEDVAKTVEILGELIAPEKYLRAQEVANRFAQGPDSAT